MIMVAMTFFAVVMGVQLARLDAMMHGVRAMSARAVRVMRRHIGVVFFVMPGGQAVMMGSLFVMFGGRMVMGAGGVLVRHEELLLVDSASTHASNKRNMSVRVALQKLHVAPQ